MKILLFITCTILGLAWSAGCHKSDTATQNCPDTVFTLPRDTFELCPGQTASLMTDNSVFVRFDTVLGDSRCPTDVQCVWAGIAAVQITLGQQSFVRTDTLSNSADMLDAVFTTTSWNNLNIKLIELTPYPVHDNSIDPDDYRILCVVWQE